MFFNWMNKLMNSTGLSSIIVPERNILTISPQKIGKYSMEQTSALLCFMSGKNVIVRCFMFYVYVKWHMAKM